VFRGERRWIFKHLLYNLATMRPDIEVHQPMNAPEGALVTRTEKYRQRLLDELRHPKRGSLTRQALANYAEWKFADNEDMARQAGDINRERMYEPVDEEAQYYYGSASRYVEGCVAFFQVSYLHENSREANEVSQANLAFEQKLVEMVTQEVTDQDHPVWRSSRLIRARQPQTSTGK
jgi:hypothetical protein